MAAIAASSKGKLVAIGLSAAAHVLAVGVIAYKVVTPQAEGGGAPVITLDLTPTPRFDSDRAGGQPEAVVSRASPSTAAARPRAVPIRVREPKPLPVDPPEPIPASPFKAAATSIPKPAVRTGEAAPAAAPSPAGERTVEAGGTTGGGAQTVGGAGAASVDPYAAQVLAWIEKHKRHPGGGGSGTVTVGFTLDRRGAVLDVRLVRSSGRPELDAAAVSQIRATQPFPRPAPGATWRRRSFDVQIRYRAR